MDEICFHFGSNLTGPFWWSAVVEELSFLANRIGYYGSPPNGVVLRTLNEFFYGSTNLDFHVYYSLIEDAWENFPL